MTLPAGNQTSQAKKYVKASAANGLDSKVGYVAAATSADLARVKEAITDPS